MNIDKNVSLTSSKSSSSHPETIIQPNTSCNGKTDQMLVVVYYFYGFNGTNILYHKTDLCGDYSLLSWHGPCPIYSRFVANTRFLGADFYADIWDLT